MWAAKNAWFGTDVEMTYHAFEVHDHLIQQGSSVNTPEYYAEISAEVEAQFPEKFVSVGAEGLLIQSSETVGTGEGVLRASQLSRQSSVVRTTPGMYRQTSLLFQPQT